MSGSMSAKTGVGSGHRDRVRGRGERERRDDDLVAGPDSRGQEAEVQARGSRVDGDAGAPADDRLGELALERRDLRALRQHPAASTRITASRSAAPNDTTVAGTERWLMLDSCELRS